MSPIDLDDSQVEFLHELQDYLSRASAGEVSPFMCPDCDYELALIVKEKIKLHCYMCGTTFMPGAFVRQQIKDLKNVKYNS